VFDLGGKQLLDKLAFKAYCHPKEFDFKRMTCVQTESGGKLKEHLDNVLHCVVPAFTAKSDESEITDYINMVLIQAEAHETETLALTTYLSPYADPQKTFDIFLTAIDKFQKSKDNAWLRMIRIVEADKNIAEKYFQKFTSKYLAPSQAQKPHSTKFVHTSKGKQANEIIWESLDLKVRVVKGNILD